MNCGIYKITNIINNKLYIGSSIRINSRWNEHKRNLNKGEHDNIHLQLSWQKYGESNFIFEIIEEIQNPTKQILEQREQYWINYNQSYERENGYNICKIAGTCLGKIHTNETRQKMSESHKGKILSHETRQKLRELNLGSKNPFYGKHHSEEHRRKISEFFSGENSPNYGRCFSDEHKRKISESKIGKNNPNFGKKHSEETKRKMSKANSGENNSTSILTWIQVREIRQKYIPRKYTMKMLSKEYNVSYGCIRGILDNKSWKER